MFWSTVFTAIAAIAALATVWQAASASNQLINSQRPYFDIEAPGIKLLPQSPFFRIQITFKNIGIHPASDVVGTIFMIDRTTKNKPSFKKTFSLANDIFQNSPTPWYIDEVQMTRNVPGQFILVGIKYKDRILSKIFQQEFIMKWDGVRDGTLAPDFVHASIEERIQITESQPKLLSEYTENIGFCFSKIFWNLIVFASIGIVIYFLNALFFKKFMF